MAKGANTLRMDSDNPLMYERVTDSQVSFPLFTWLLNLEVKTSDIDKSLFMINSHMP